MNRAMIIWLAAAFVTGMFTQNLLYPCPVTVRAAFSAEFPRKAMTPEECMALEGRLNRSGELVFVLSGEWVYGKNTVMQNLQVQDKQSGCIYSKIIVAEGVQR